MRPAHPIQQQFPGPDRESDWLPAPDGPFYMTLRLSGPEELALEGEWIPPSAELVRRNQS